MLASTALLFGFLSAGTATVLAWSHSQTTAHASLARLERRAPDAAVPPGLDDVLPQPSPGKTHPDMSGITGNLQEPPPDAKPGKIEYIDHDKLSAIPSATSFGVLGALEERFQPTLFIKDGCEPYPVVSREGKISGGLKPTGKSGGQCTPNNKIKNPGQVWVRHATYEGRDIFMYCWSFPKVNKETRIYFSCSTVWLDRISCSAPDDVNTFKIAAVFATVHYDKMHQIENPSHMKLADNSGDATHVALQQDLLRIDAYYGPPGWTGTWNLLSWKMLPDLAKKALWNLRYGRNGDLKVPFAWESTFKDILTSQYRADLFKGPKCPTVADDEDPLAASASAPPPAKGPETPPAVTKPLPPPQTKQPSEPSPQHGDPNNDDKEKKIPIVDHDENQKHQGEFERPDEIDTIII